MKSKFSLFIQYRGAINKEKEKCSQALSTISRRNLSVSEVAISARFSNISLHHHPADQSQLCVSRLMIYVLGHQWRWTAATNSITHSTMTNWCCNITQGVSTCISWLSLTIFFFFLLPVCWCWWCCSADVSSVTTQCLPLSTQPRTTHTVGHSTHKYFTNQPRQKYFNQAQLENISSTCLEKYLTGMKQRKLFDCPGIRMLRTLSICSSSQCVRVLVYCATVLWCNVARVGKELGTTILVESIRYKLRNFTCLHLSCGHLSS